MLYFSYTMSLRKVEIDGVKLGKIEGAEVFLSEVWKQLRNLYFEWNGNCYEPLEDERLANKKNKTKWMYHAIGRLISFSLLHGIKPPRKILPPSLWVHLFRGTDYLETDNCFQSFAFDMRANEESNVQELCTEYGVARLGEDEHFDSFLKRIYPVVLDHAKTQERDYRSARQLSWAALKEGFEYSQIPFDSKQKFTNNLQERLSLCVRQSVASDPWTAAASILAEECTEEESVEYLDL